MLVNLLFPFDENLLQNSKTNAISSDDRNRFVVFAVILICSSFLFITVGSFPASAKAILLIPALLGFLIAFLLFITSKSKQSFFLGIVLLLLSLDYFFMAISIVFSSNSNISVNAVCARLAYALVAFFVLLVLAYRIHFCYQLKRGGVFEKTRWSNTYTAIIVVAGISLSKVLSPTWAIFLLWIVWICIHVVLSGIVLEYRKYKAVDK